MDLATRYCSATVIKHKLSGTIINVSLGSWITLFGGPSKILIEMVAGSIMLICVP